MQTTLGRRCLALVFCCLSTSIAACSPEVSGEDREPKIPLEIYEVRFESVIDSTSEGGSSFSSRTRYGALEKVLGDRGEGIELEFDLPDGATPEDRLAQWKFPARVMATPDGGLQLLNAPEVAERIQSLLDRRGLTREACGRTYFTWAAFTVECDPGSVLEHLAPFSRPRLEEGAAFREQGALAPAPLVLAARDADGETWVAEMALDAEYERRQRAQIDATVAEMSGKQKTLEAALKEWQDRRVAGTIITTFLRDPSGQVVSRTKVTRVETVDDDGKREVQTETETTTRGRMWP